MDTAELYAVPGSKETSGRTEEIIGTWLKKTGKRDQWIIASKIAGGGNSFIRNGAPPNRQSIRTALEQSLTRMNTDYVDLYQIHWASRGSYNFDNSWTYHPHRQNTQAALDELEDMLQGLNDLVREGKIRHIGVSNETAWGLGQWAKLSEKHDLPRIASIQNEYSLLRRHFDLDLAEVSHHEGIGLLAYSTLAVGILTGKYSGDVSPKNSRRDYQKEVWRINEQSLAAADEYVSLAKRHGINPAQMAIAFTLSRPFLTSAIIGATNLDQLKLAIRAHEVSLSEELLAEIEVVHRKYPRPL
jgi:aryl-alcohol dehydrogenase-like predicted oxidoreductase